jgi:tetratricopeptide (TPR) repeat protein
MAPATYEAAVTSMRLYNQIYPDNASNWFALAKMYTYLGQTGQAIDSAEYAYRLDPHSGTGAEILARAYRRANRLADAKRIAEVALAQGKDRWGMHSLLFQIAFLEQDAAGMKTESEWGFTHQELDQSLTDVGFVAASEGKLREAASDFTRARQEALHGGDTDFADIASMWLAGIYLEYGDPVEAAACLKQMKSDGGDPGTTAQFKAEMGDFAPAQRLISKIASSGTKSTLSLYFDLPELSALLAVKVHQPAEALKDLEPARKYQMRDIGVPYQRARAEVDAGLLDQAAQDYRLIIDNPGIDPIWPNRIVSHLRLARVLVQQHRLGEARAEYQAFLDAWKDGDADVPLLVQAREEYAKLKTQ